MTELLKEELARIGETVTPAYVAPDTWARGRRARRRDRLLVGAAVLALIASLGGLVGLVRPGGPDLPPATPSESGVGSIPSHIWNVPEQLTWRDPDGQWKGPVETNPSIGRVSVAYVAPSGLPVLVTAADGRYHLMSLDGWLGQSQLVRLSAGRHAALSLSPDGTQLAYAWAGPVPRSDAERQPTGIRILDLISGSARTVPVWDGRGVAVDSIVWSPDGRWLAWAGRTANGGNAPSNNLHAKVAGRIRPGASASQEVPLSGRSAAGLAISSDGRLAFSSGGRFQLWKDKRVSSQPLSASIPPIGSWSPDGSRVVVGLFGALGEVHADVSANVVRPHTLRGIDPGGIPVTPLGWVDAGHLVAVAPSGPSGGDDQDLQLVLVSAPISPREPWTYSVITGSELSYETLTVAVGMITDLNHPTRDFPEPDWPWSTGHKLWVGAVALAVVGLATYLLFMALGLGLLVRRALWAMEIVLAALVFCLALTFVAVMVGVALRADTWFGRGVPIAMALLPMLAVRNIGLGLWDRWKAWRVSRADTPSGSDSSSPR